jgi:hypothetical protein
VPDGTPPLERQVWRREEGMTIRRALRVAAYYQLTLIVGCNDHRCAEDPRLHEFPLAGGGFEWRCRHLRREVLTGR